MSKCFTVVMKEGKWAITRKIVCLFRNQFVDTMKTELFSQFILCITIRSSKVNNLARITVLQVITHGNLMAQRLKGQTNARYPLISYFQRTQIKFDSRVN